MCMCVYRTWSGAALQGTSESLHYKGHPYDDSVAVILTVFRG